MSLDDFKKKLYSCVTEGKVAEAPKLSEEIQKNQMDLKIIGKVLSEAMEKVGTDYRERVIALPQLLLATQCFKKVLAGQSTGEKEKAIVVIGTVQNDVHDIGKSLVAALLQVYGYKVYDIGKDVPIQNFLEKAKEVNANIVGASTLMTSTMMYLNDIIKLFEENNMRNQVKLMVGGAPLSPEYARHIGADGYAVDAVLAVEATNKVLNGEKCYLK